VSENQIGLVEALDGAPLDPKDYVATPLPDTIISGFEYVYHRRWNNAARKRTSCCPVPIYINPLLFKVILDSAKEIKPGEVAVVVSNTGKDPSEEIRRAMAQKIRERLEQEKPNRCSSRRKSSTASMATKHLSRKSKPNCSRATPPIKGSTAALTRLMSYQRDFAVSRKRSSARDDITLILWPCLRSSFRRPTRLSNGPRRGAGTFDPFEVISKDGFTMQLEVRVVFRVKPEDAPFMVAKIGDVTRLIQNVMHPLIDSIFRNQASESSAMAYLQNRHEEQERAEARVRMHLLKYHVDVVNVLICHIHLPEELMKTQTEKILAELNETAIR